MDKDAAKALAKAAIDYLAKSYGFDEGAIGDVTETKDEIFIQGFIYRSLYQVSISFGTDKPSLLVSVQEILGVGEEAALRTHAIEFQKGEVTQ